MVYIYLPPNIPRIRWNKDEKKYETWNERRRFKTRLGALNSCVYGNESRTAQWMGDRDDDGKLGYMYIYVPTIYRYNIQVYEHSWECLRSIY